MNNRVKGFLLASFGAVSWGISGVCSQYVFMNYDVNAEWLTAVRMVLSGIALLIIALPAERLRIFRIWKSKNDVMWLMAFAVIGLLMCQYTFLAAIKYSNSATTTVLQSLNVVIMAVLMSVWHKKRMSAMRITAVVMAMCGTYLIATKGNPASMELSAAGLVFGLLSALGVVTYTLLSRPIISKWGNLVITGWGMLIGGMVLTAVAKAWRIPEELDAIAFLMVAVVVLIGTAVGFSAFLQSIRYIGPVKATLIGCLEPVSATVISVAALGSQFSWAEYLGFAFIICTVFISVLSGE